MRLVLLCFLLLSSLGCEKRTVCKGEEDCIEDPKCLCWCSVLCNYRKKNASDHPTYIQDDPNGKHCYCKRWDFDHYEDNCIQHKKIKEPEGAQ